MEYMWWYSSTWTLTLTLTLPSTWLGKQSWALRHSQARHFKSTITDMLFQDKKHFIFTPCYHWRGRSYIIALIVSATDLSMHELITKCTSAKYPMQLWMHLRIHWYRSTSVEHTLTNCCHLTLRQQRSLLCMINKCIISSIPCSCEWVHLATCTGMPQCKAGWLNAVAFTLYCLADPMLTNVQWTPPLPPPLKWPGPTNCLLQIHI